MLMFMGCILRNHGLKASLYSKILQQFKIMCYRNVHTMLWKKQHTWIFKKRFCREKGWNNKILKIIRTPSTFLYSLQYTHFSNSLRDEPFLISLLWPLLSLAQILWTFSIYLESVAILPQLFMISKTGEAETITTHYLFFLGLYRALYLANWIRRYQTENFYDQIAVVSGVVQTIFYCDFFYLYVTKGKCWEQGCWHWPRDTPTQHLRGLEVREESLSPSLCLFWWETNIFRKQCHEKNIPNRITYIQCENTTRKTAVDIIGKI